MPVSAEKKAESLARDLGGQAKLAAVLGVERSTVSRWVRGGAPDHAHAAKVDALEFVLAEAERIFGRAGARKWLNGLDPHLGNRRPVDLLRRGQFHEIVRALAEHRAGSYA
jgi:transcriptional regulator with XRE-family HTH domain